MSHGPRPPLIPTLMTLSLTVIALACCMVPTDFDGRISQNRQQALLIHDGEREELVLRINYKITGSKAPDYFAWVVTVPEEPEAYRVADSKVFDELKQMTRALLRPVVRSESKGMTTLNTPQAAAEPESAPLDFGKRVQVGPFDIQPVRTRGVEALDALNTWLKSEGFPTEAPDHMRYFSENNFTFLAIKVQPAADAQLAISETLPPLQLSFTSKHAYYPLRFSSRQGVFDLDLWTLTAKPFAYKANASILKELNWGNTHYHRNVRVPQVSCPKALTTSLTEGKLDGKTTHWYFNYINGIDVNSDDRISKWSRDIFFDGQALR